MRQMLRPATRNSRKIKSRAPLPFKAVRGPKLTYRASGPARRSSFENESFFSTGVGSDTIYAYPMPVTVSIVEDHQGTRESLVALLKAEPSMKCLGAHGSGEAAVKAIPNEKPDVAIVDINLPGMSGIECVACLKGR